MLPRWKPLRRVLRPDVGTEIDEELRFHLEARIAEYEKHGYSRADAERLARERFGDAEHVRSALAKHDEAERSRERRHDFLSDVTQDVRIALRGLRRTPAFTVTVLATLAIGIGANTAVFSVVSRELIDALPYRASDRLVLLYTASAQDERGFVSANDVSRLQQAGGPLTDVAAFGQYGGYTYVGQHETVTWSFAQAGPHFFRTLGVRPFLGRLIDDRDLGADTATIVLSYDVWQRDFGGDSNVVGRTLRLNDEPFTVVGVLGRDFVPPARAPQIWIPLPLGRFLHSKFASGRMFQAVARLSPGATRTQAEAALRVLSHPAGAAGATAQADRASLTAVPIRDAMVGDVRPVLLVVMGAALLVLLLACVNVAGLFFARSAARRRELAVRAALGAGQWRLLRQLLTETTVLGIGGGGLGVLFAFWVKNVLVGLGSGVIAPTGAPAAIDARALAFAVIASLTVGIVAGLAPALLDARADPNAALGDTSRGATGSRRTQRIGRALVAGQMALAVVLLVGAGLLTRTLVALEHTGLGYSGDQHVLTFGVSLPSNAYPDWPQRSQFFTAWLARLRDIPGVRGAGMANVAPWQGWNHWWVRIDNASGRGTADSADAPLARVSDGYFGAAGTPLRAGRDIRASDRPGSLPVAVVSQDFADRWWPHGNALGGRIRVVGIDSTWRTVVGIVGDVRETPSSAPEPGVYLSAWQVPRPWFAFAVRSDGNAANLLPVIKRELRILDPTLPVGAPRTMDQIVSSSLAGRRLPMLLTGAFALLALALAALGMYGVVAYAVTLRTREIGIRAALGGRRGDIVGLVLKDGLTTAVVGVVLGTLVAVGGARVLTGLLYGVTAHDPATYVGAIVVLLIASVAACLVPARRALQVHPVEALRVE
ncbi:MAG: ADOP family duplicated permease [Gemmatimonadaceae bacterium]